jgi:hypothetical protein
MNDKHMTAIYNLKLQKVNKIKNAHMVSRIYCQLFPTLIIIIFK